jgi:hypothetical protein
MDNLLADLEYGEMYCPVCCMVLQPLNFREVEEGSHDGYLYRHLNVEHSSTDIQALRLGIQ